MTTAPSLRDLYTKEHNASWSFASSIPEPDKVTTNASSIPSAPPATFQWSSRPARNSVLDLSPDLNDGSGFNTVQVVKALTASALLQYASSTIAMPWEVGKLLLQVQYVPQEMPPALELEDDDESELSDSSIENENDSYFADPDSTPKAPHTRHKDDVRRSVAEERFSSEFVIPAGSVDGVWGMIKQLGRFRGEGWFALWKGLLTSCISEVLSSVLQPMLQGAIQSIFLSSSSLLHQPPVFVPVLAHLITGIIISPLDLIRTRLIVQAYAPNHRNYKGPLDAAQQIIRDEGGLYDMYFHPQLFIPAVIDNTLRPVVALALPGMLISYFGLHVTEDANPIAWGLAELAGSCVGLLVTLPFETVRRRLQVQVRGSAKPIRGCVSLRRTPYHGVVDALWSILTEERSDLPIIPVRPKPRRLSTKTKEKEDALRHREEQSWLRHTGIGQLYRGLGMRLSASVIVFCLALVSGDQDGDSGWAEL